MTRLGGWVIAARWPILVITLIPVAIAASGVRFIFLLPSLLMKLDSDSDDDALAARAARDQARP